MESKLWLGVPRGAPSHASLFLVRTGKPQAALGKARGCPAALRSGHALSGESPQDRGRIRARVLVDDNISIRKLVTIVLTGAGFKVDSTGNGTKALQMFRRRPYVITDLLHPGLKWGRTDRQNSKAEAVAPCTPLHGLSNPHSGKAMCTPRCGQRCQEPNGAQKEQG
jgi:hypothetical protein